MLSALLWLGDPMSCRLPSVATKQTNQTHLELVKSFLLGTELRESWVEALGSVPLPTSEGELQ